MIYAEYNLRIFLSYQYASKYWQRQQDYQVTTGHSLKTLTKLFLT